MLGRTVSHYKILDRLGAGGMGEVFVAHDEELDRDVAFKILPSELSGDPARIERFKREAKAIAALNHPNIVTVHSVENADGIHFITMELVKGKTLGRLLPKAGFPLNQFYELAIPLADAVAAAHVAGIAHRDLKPDNVMVTDDGRVKVLDFGLAKETGARDVGSELPTREMTEQGLIVGTPQYMSPEQASGERVDTRSDLFSLGAMLYLMLTGRHPFAGRSAAAILSSILKDIPEPVTDVNPTLPGLLGRTVRRCLEKDPDERLQSAKDLRNELRELSLDPTAGVVPPVTAPLGHATKWPFLLAAAVLATGGATYFAARGGSDAPTATSPTLTQLTSAAGQELFSSLSPDGSFVAYAKDTGGDFDIYLQRVGGENPVNLTPSSRAHDTHPSFSPDGNSIAFRSERDGGGVFVMGATGESVRRVTDFGCSPAWSPDGSKLAIATGCGVENPHSRSTRSELWVVTLATGERRLLSETDAAQPSWSPRGARIAFWSTATAESIGQQRDIWTIPAGGGERTAVTEDAWMDWTPVWSPNGRYLYFSSDRGGSMNLWRIAMDEAAGTPTGEPESVTIGATASHQHHSFSADGAKLAYVESVVTGHLWKLPFDPESGRATSSPRPITSGSGTASRVDVSPDGQRLAYYDKGNAGPNIFVIDADGQNRRQLLNDAHRNMFPRWSPDGEKLGFYSNRNGSWELWTIAPDGSGLQQITDTPNENLTQTVWSPDGSRLAYNMLSQGLNYIVDTGTPWSEQTPESIPPPDVRSVTYIPHAWSPDGRFLAGAFRNQVAHWPAIYDLESQSYTDSADIVTAMTTNEVEFPGWLPDSSGVVFVGRDKTTGERGIYMADREFGSVSQILGDPSATSAKVSPDGQWIYFCRDTLESDVWLLSFGEP